MSPKIRELKETLKLRESTLDTYISIMDASTTRKQRKNYMYRIGKIQKDMERIKREIQEIEEQEKQNER